MASGMGHHQVGHPKMPAQWRWQLGTSATGVGGIVNKRPRVCLFLSCDSTSDPLVRDSGWHSKCSHLGLVGSPCIRSRHEPLSSLWWGVHSRSPRWAPLSKHHPRTAFPRWVGGAIDHVISVRGDIGHEEKYPKHQGIVSAHIR